MTLEEINKWLDNEYGVSYTKLEELHDFYFEKYCDLKKENQSLKKQLENANEQINYLRRSIERKEETIIDLQDERIPYTNEYVAKLENQQKKFIDYLENEIKERKIQILGYHPTTQLLIEQIIETEKMVLSKYQEIIGVSNENNMGK